jgi:hypothetical protein
MTPDDTAAAFKRCVLAEVLSLDRRGQRGHLRDAAATTGSLPDRRSNGERDDDPRHNDVFLSGGALCHVVVVLGTTTMADEYEQ